MQRRAVQRGNAGGAVPRQEHRGRAGDDRSRRARPSSSETNAIGHKLRTLNELGLGYLKLGHPATKLSGGEAQRIKLAYELGKIKHGKHNLYILDEPTTGLHIADIQKLLDSLNRLVEVGHTVVVIEHHLDVIKTADWVIDLGPDGGAAGGLIVGEGTPEQVALIEASYTGRYLRGVLEVASGQPG